MGKTMIVTTLETVAGRPTEATLGAVRGTALWTTRMTKSCLGGIRDVQAVGMRGIGEGLNQAKESASQEIQAEAHRLGADAVVALKLEVIEMSNGVFCVNASGTAVRTMALPHPLPAYSRAGGGTAIEQDTEDFSFPAFMAGRPAFEGSVLRH